MSGDTPATYLNAMPSALIAVERDSSVVFLNQAAEMLLGVSSAHSVGRSLSSLPGMDGELCAYCERVFSTGEAIDLFEQLLRLPLNHRIVTLHITPVVVDKGAVQQLLITVEKTEGLDRLAGSVWKQEASRAAGVMAAMMAHEVKNPLSGIRGAAQLLHDEVAPEHQALAELICLETDRIRDLLNQVEVFAGSEVEHKHPVNIHEALQYVISIAQTGFAAHVTFKEKYDPSLPEVWAHRDLLVQMFLNLIKNSAEAMLGNADPLANPVVTISTAYRSGYRVRSRQAGTKESTSLPVVVTIEDNGPGIPENVRAHLFEPFVSSKEQGRGLGLAVIAKIASDMGIVVELDQEHQQGTKFLIWLPIVPK